MRNKKSDENNKVGANYFGTFFLFTLRQSVAKRNPQTEERKMKDKPSELKKELISLFNLKKSRIRDEKTLIQEAFDAQRDIRYLTLMFCDGIPDVTIPVTDFESLKWDSRAQKILYIKYDEIQLLEGAPREVMVKMRPHLTDLVKRAKMFFEDFS